MSSDISASSPRTGRFRHANHEYKVAAQVVAPERNLIAAVLGRAILDLYGEANTARLTTASARTWLYGPIKEDEMFSFGWVAKQLDLDPEVLQDKLKEYSQDRENLVKCLNFLR